MATLEASAAGQASTLGQLSWAVFDAGRGPYSILINTFVFSAYFTTVVFADPVQGQTVWSYLSSIGAFLVALGAPILGAVADAGGRRKPWLLGCVILGAPCMAALWYATPGMASGFSWVFLAPIGATLAFEYRQSSATPCCPTCRRLAGSGS
jgi:MFS transporter, UMF1 family